MSKKRIPVRLDSEFIAEIDKAKPPYVSRNEFIEMHLKRALNVNDVQKFQKYQARIMNDLRGIEEKNVIILDLLFKILKETAGLKNKDPQSAESFIAKTSMSLISDLQSGNSYYDILVKIMNNYMKEEQHA